MRKIYTLICIGIISSTGFTVQAQSSLDMESVIQSMAAGNTTSVTRVVESIAGSLREVTQTGPQTSAIEGRLVVDTVVPEVNRTAADVLIGDSRTGRYPPKLKINFAEFPLKTLTTSNDATNGQGGRNGASTTMVVQRIQSRLRMPEVNIEIEGRTAIVSGTVETELQRSRVETMLRFEPGIDVVKNEITVE